jgi:O-succinylbenzoic acid--CoA ligase
VPRLVAVVAEGGPGFVEALQAAWDAGDAVAPVDPRLPRPAAEAVLDILAPSVLVGPDGATSPRPGGRPVEEDDALVVVTSGTGGAPKGVVLTHAAVRSAALTTSAALEVDSRRDRWLACLPLAHVGGLSVVTRALLTGTALTVLPRADPAAIAAEARRGATLVSLVPTLLARMDTTPFRRVLVGGAAPPAERPSNVVATYGMTETGGGVVYDGTPLAGVEVRAVDGELHVRGPMLLRGYRDGADPKDAGGWLPTGDGGDVAADGRVTVTGRLADVVVTGGEKVWPAPVEAALAAHEAVAEVAVAGRPDREWGQRVVAFVVPAHAEAPPTLQALRAEVKRSLPAYAAPRELVLVPALPRTPLGKVRRVDLAASARPGETLGKGDA